MSLDSPELKHELPTFPTGYGRRLGSLYGIGAVLANPTLATAATGPCGPVRIGISETTCTDDL